MSHDETTIALVDDDSLYGRELAERLRSAGVRLNIFRNVRDFAQEVTDEYSAVVVANPGLHEARSLRVELEKAGGLVSRLPVIGALSDSTSPPDRDTLRHLDDFVTGTSPEEIRARVEFAVLKRPHIKLNVITAGEVEIDVDAHRVFLKGKPVDLTYKEFELLKMMAATPGRAYTREELLRRIWGYDYFGGTRTVDVHIRRLRAKLEGPGRVIETVHGVGYRLALRQG